MKRRALSTVSLAVLISALTASLAFAGNPHGTPPGQAKQDQTASASSSGSASAQGSVSATTTTPAGPTGASGSTSSTSKTNTGGGKFSGCSAPANTTTTPGVKPSNSTSKWTCAPAGSNQTKEYGNGNTAGNIVTSRG